MHVCVCVCALECRYLQGREEGSRSLELELQAGFEQFNAIAGNSSQTTLNLSAYFFYLYTAVRSHQLPHNFSIILTILWT